jgi:hypothetical protein
MTFRIQSVHTQPIYMQLTATYLIVFYLVIRIPSNSLWNCQKWDFKYLNYVYLNAYLINLRFIPFASDLYWASGGRNSIKMEF